MQYQHIEIRHTAPGALHGWEVWLDGKRVENLVGFNLDCRVDQVP